MYFSIGHPSIRLFLQVDNVMQGVYHSLKFRSEISGLYREDSQIEKKSVAE
jgi:hypothetical protein